VKLPTHLHLVSRSRMRGAISPRLQYAFMAWRSVKVQGQLYLYQCINPRSANKNYFRVNDGGRHTPASKCLITKPKVLCTVLCRFIEMLTFMKDVAGLCNWDETLRTNSINVYNSKTTIHVHSTPFLCIIFRSIHKSGLMKKSPR
jgi:hypothetical protein